MIVYLVYFDTQDYYEGEQFHSAFSSRELAQQFIDRQKPGTEQPFYKIDEYELDCGLTR